MRIRTPWGGRAPALFVLLFVAVASPLPSAADPVAGADPCAECLVGPVELEIERGKPRVSLVAFRADPTDDYTLVVERLSASDASALVLLNGRILLHFGQPLSTDEPVSIPASLWRVNVLYVAIRGEGGGRIRFALVRDSAIPPSRQPCGPARDFFTHLPVDLTLLSSIFPLGTLSPPSHTLPTHHLYMNTVLGLPEDPATATIVDVFAPGRAEIVGVVRNSPTDFQIHLQPCREVRTYFETRSLDRLIEDQLEPDAWVYLAGSPEAGPWAQRTSIVVNGGQRIGNGPTPGAINVAWGLIDYREPPLPFANPARYDLSLIDLSEFPPEVVAIAPYIMPERLHQFCPADYFAPTLPSYLADGFRALLGRSVPPICGEIEQDEPGSAQGSWFTGPTATDASEEDETLALVHDNVFPGIPMFSVSQAFCEALPGGGESCSWIPGRRRFTPAASGFVNRDFDDVAPGAIYCYHNLTHATVADPAAEAGRVLIEVLPSPSDPSTDRLRIEPVARAVAAACGSGPWSFGAGMREFQR